MSVTDRLLPGFSPASFDAERVSQDVLVCTHTRTLASPRSLRGESRYLDATTPFLCRDFRGCKDPCTLTLVAYVYYYNATGYVVIYHDTRRASSLRNNVINTAVISASKKGLFIFPNISLYLGASFPSGWLLLFVSLPRERE